MAKQPSGGPLEGTVNVVGARTKVSVADRDAVVADLTITLTGGSGRTAVPITFAVGLNVPVSGRARLTDASTSRVLAESTRSGAGYLFKDVPVTPPGALARTFRITNLRANAAGIGASSGVGPSQIVAFVSASGPFRIPLARSQQNVADVAKR
jgi:hypothetical protein